MQTNGKTEIPNEILDAEPSEFFCTDDILLATLRLTEWADDKQHLIQSVRSHEPTYKTPAQLRRDVRALLFENRLLTKFTTTDKIEGQNGS